MAVPAVVRLSVPDVSEKAIGDCSAKATLRRGFAGSGNENGFKEAGALCFLVERDVREQREIGFKRVIICTGG